MCATYSSEETPWIMTLSLFLSESVTEAYLERSQKSMMERFWENS